MLADSVGSGRCRGRKRSAAAVGGLDSGGRGRSSTPAAQTRRKVPEPGEDDDQSEKKFRKCEKSGCPAMYPMCFASASERCARNGYTSRWYHLSCGEHFCNECFDHYYRSHKDGYETFSSWKRVWTSNGKSEPSLKAFMADQELPYWVQCTKADCGKWRQLSKDTHLSAALASSYCCGMKLSSSKVEGSDACSQPEDLRVAGVTDSWWLSMLILPPLFKDSPATPFLSCYYPDCVGMSPSASPSNHPPGNQRPEQRRAAQPHSESRSVGRSQPGLSSSTLMIRLLTEVDLIQTLQANQGFFTQWSVLKRKHPKYTFKSNVVVLEARERIGGRVWDDASLGVTVGCGAQIVNGCVNNPIALMCEQLGLRMHTLGVRCELIQEGGRVTDTALDKRMDFHFNAVLDAVSEWRKDKSQSQDAPLGGEMHVMRNQESRSTNLYTVQVSACSWDHNECFAQFSGDHTLLADGYSSVLHKLAQELDIRLNTAVQHVDYSGEGVTVTSRCGSRWSAQKVLVTVPLALLQKNIIGFSPPLPDRKLKAIHSLGAGVIEKVALQFPTRFWDSKIQGADYFGHIPPCPEKRGLFSVFYDMCPQGDECVLMTVVTGEALSLLRDLQDSQVVDLCMSVLRELFQEQEVPDPLRFLVTRWSRDPWAQMSYSFVKTGGSGEAYDIIAEDVQGKLFFAGEATNRHFPQTVTGAYLSGVREASKIAAL
ncbi:lysine-specific histone demethylase 1B [Sinocyclocheilus grahami]|uniref:lysine-specific histone demethylase 1B n=1 Tax=Sinocyclocheilus grahami TaxID=75366 RepID=UPI0007AD13DD|nr:PREDICTED: lysine-specific histone demethylase 1B [Sinocyclocheilus grahami]